LANDVNQLPLFKVHRRPEVDTDFLIQKIVVQFADRTRGVCNRIELPALRQLQPHCLQFLYRQFLQPVLHGFQHLFDNQRFFVNGRHVLNW